MSDAVIILSGGLDSTTLAYDIVSRKQHDKLYALSFNYRQKHKRELQCAIITAKKLGIPHRIVDLSSISSLLRSSLTSLDIDVPEGEYDAPSMSQTVVPNRNMIMLSIAAGFCISNDVEFLFYGAHSGDHNIYFDCRPEFINALRLALILCDEKGVKLLAPYQDIDKGDIVKIGLDLGVPFTDTWTCYKGQEKPCGVCGSCDERKKAFKDNNAIDPLE